jgi:hypothetical protein
VIMALPARIIRREALMGIVFLLNKRPWCGRDAKVPRKTKLRRHRHRPEGKTGLVVEGGPRGRRDRVVVVIGVHWHAAAVLKEQGRR